ncbi:uncharacterized protein [Henckelia pumila]|uniref:uncharacterized protein isoform X2 n=1 Tax=Henckelia pumila TaxID=405737 RepID=UPI003C6DC0F0
MGFRPVDDSQLSFLREMCDKYFDPRDCAPGAGITRFYIDGIEHFNYMAELALKFYNDKEQKDFSLEIVGKLNMFVVLYCLTFWARIAESDERRLFRGVVDVLGGDKVLLCEIKDDGEFTIPVDHSENCRLRCSWRDEYAKNDYAGGSMDASSGSSVGLGDVDLSNVQGYCPMGHSMLWALRGLCDTYFDPCDSEPGAGITYIHFDGSEIVDSMASLALKFYNDKERKNFYLEEVGKLNVFIAYYCLTFWAQTAKSNERHLFRGVVHVTDVNNVVLCEIKDDNEITTSVCHSVNCRLKRARNDDKENDTVGGSVDDSSQSAACHGFVNLGKVDGFVAMGSALSSLRELCDKCFDPYDHDPSAGITRFNVDGFEYVKELAESALKCYNEKERKNFSLEKVGKLNIFVTYYCLTFWARSAETGERPHFRGVVDVLGGVNVILCEIEDGDEITSPVDYSENYHLKRTRIDDYDYKDTVNGSVDANSGASVGRGGVDPCRVDVHEPEIGQDTE